MTTTDAPLDVEVTADGLSIRLPPAGLRSAKAETRFAFAFAAVVAVLSVFFWWIIRLSNAPTTFTVMSAVVLGLFACIAIGLLIGAWRRSRRMAIVDVVGDTLLINTSMPGWNESIQIERGNIKALGVGPSGVVVDDRPVLALRIDLGKPVPVGKERKRALKLFRERDERELHALAERLREALNVGSSEGAGWEEDAASSRSPEGHLPLR